MNMVLVWSVGSFFVILVILVLLRAINNRLEVKPADIVVSILPVLVFLLVTGRLQKFEIGEGGVKIETAFVKASKSAIVSQITPLTGLPSKPLRIDPKGAVRDIPKLIEHKTEGLLFRLGYGRYWGPAITEYFRLLSKQPFLKYIIVENPDGTFYAMANARELIELFQTEHPPYTAKDFAKWLNDANTTALTKLPGFISVEDAITENTDKDRALRKMEKLNVDTLPVIDEAKRFVGIVDRSRLIASLLIDVVASLKK